MNYELQGKDACLVLILEREDGDLNKIANEGRKRRKHEWKNRMVDSGVRTVHAQVDSSQFRRKDITTTKLLFTALIV